MFPQEEYESRINKVRLGMSELGLSALVVMDNEHHRRGGSVRYLSNFVSLMSPDNCAVVITPADVILCANPGFLDSAFRLAKHVSAVSDLIGTRSGLWGHALAGDIKAALSKAKVTKGKLGVDGFNLMPEPEAKAIRAALSGYELVENTGIVDKVRMVKSPAEIRVIREAAKITDVVAEGFENAVKAGQSVATSLSGLQHDAISRGAELVDVSVSPSQTDFIWGNPAGHSQNSLGEVYKEGDMVSYEMSVRIHGYFAQVARGFVVGKASAKQKKVYDAVIETYNKLVSALKPGAKASEMFAAGSESLRGAGFEQISMRSGHGVGITIAEGFDLFTGDNTEIQPGFIVMIHPCCPIDNGYTALGHSFLVTGTGCEQLTKAKFRLEV